MTYYIGWKLPTAERKRLLNLIKPVYADVIAHHITLEYDVPADVQLPTATSGEIVGIADDGEGVQALVVRIGGTTRRPDGSIYHITWSLAKGRKSAESNAVIRKGWKHFPESIGLVLEPKLFRSK